MRKLGRIKIVTGALAIALAMFGFMLTNGAIGEPNEGPKEPDKQDSSGPLSVKIGL